MRPNPVLQALWNRDPTHGSPQTVPDDFPEFHFPGTGVAEPEMAGQEKVPPGHQFAIDI